MEKIAKYFREKDKFARHTGIELTDVKQGYARAKLKIKEHHLNSAKLVHGGAIYTLADFVFAVASNSHGQLALGINTSINFIQAVKDGTIYAEARELAINPKLGIYSIKVTDENDQLLATFEGLVYKKKDLLNLD
jgi:acyl-CoA thioesterase